MEENVNSKRVSKVAADNNIQNIGAEVEKMEDRIAEVEANLELVKSTKVAFDEDTDDSDEEEPRSSQSGGSQPRRRLRRRSSDDVDETIENAYTENDTLGDASIEEIIAVVEEQHELED